MKVYVLTHDVNGAYFNYNSVFATLGDAKARAEEFTVQQNHSLVSEWWEGISLNEERFWQMDAQRDKTQERSYPNHFRIYETEVIAGEKAEA